MNDTENPSTDGASMGHPWSIARWLGVVALAFGILAAIMLWISKSTPIFSPITQPAELDVAIHPAPDFRLASLEGGIVSPADFAGDIVVIEFWATWCGPCRLQARFLEELEAEFTDSVQFLAINVGEDEATVQEFVAATPFPYPVLLDPEDSLSARYQIYGLPTVMIVNRQGAISYLETGVRDVPTLRQALMDAGAETSGPTV